MRSNRQHVAILNSYVARVLRGQNPSGGEFTVEGDQNNDRIDHVIKSDSIGVAVAVFAICPYS